MRKGPQVFDLPTANLHEHVGHYVVPRARNSEEAERRRQNPTGTVILEEQHDGVVVLDRIYTHLGGDIDSQLHLSEQLAPVCLNTAWYSYANVDARLDVVSIDNVARRRLDLPKHAFVEDDGRVTYETHESNDERMRKGLFHAAELAQQLELAHVAGVSGKELQLQRKFGRAIGNVGLRLSAMPLIGQRAAPHVIQTSVRNAGTAAMNQSRELYDDTYPTIAQLANPDSQLLVQLRRIATKAEYDAIVRATTEVITEQNHVRGSYK